MQNAPDNESECNVETQVSEERVRGKSLLENT